VDANPGDEVKFSWVNGEEGPWVHNTGPVMTYMASCGSVGCANFDSANAEFFKISELGKKADGSTWFMSDLNAGLNATTSATIPTNLPAGEYILRHELIALQLGMSVGGAEFYPACLQIRLGGNNATVAAASSSNTMPSGSKTVTFPGGYSDNDPGIFDPDVYNPGSSYTFPGPPLVGAAVSDPSGSTSPSDTPANTSSDDGTPTSSSTASPVPTGSGCGYSKKKKRVVKRVLRRNPLTKKSAVPAKKREATHAQPDYKRSNHAQPVVRSRMMRGI